MTNYQRYLDLQSKIHRVRKDHGGIFSETTEMTAEAELNEVWMRMSDEEKAMTHNYYQRYLDLLDELRRARMANTDDPVVCERAEELINDDLDGLWLNLSKAEQDKIRSESWRAWPDMHAERALTMRDQPVWNNPGKPPRIP